MCSTLGFMPLKSADRHFYVEMMGLIGAGNNPMVGMTVACAVAVNEALNKKCTMPSAPCLKGRGPRV